MSQHSLIPATPDDISLAATLIARTYMDLGAKMIEITGKLRTLPYMQDENGVLVADENKEAIGYALYTPVKVGNTENAAVLLAPFAYDTARAGVDATNVLQETLAYPKQKGYRYVLMHGEEETYQALGFQDADDLAITSQVSYPNTILLVKDLDAGVPASLSGEVEYPPFVF